MRRWDQQHRRRRLLDTVEDVAGRDLDWFWTTWWFETWTLDQAVSGARVEGDALVVTIEDRGLAPMPVRLAITRTDGRVERLELPVEPWLAGARTQAARIGSAATVRAVEIDPELAFRISIEGIIDGTTMRNENEDEEADIGARTALRGTRIEEVRQEVLIERSA